MRLQCAVAASVLGGVCVTCRVGYDARAQRHCYRTPCLAARCRPTGLVERPGPDATTLADVVCSQVSSGVEGVVVPLRLLIPVPVVPGSGPGVCYRVGRWVGGWHIPREGGAWRWHRLTSRPAPTCAARSLRRWRCCRGARSTRCAPTCCSRGAGRSWRRRKGDRCMRTKVGGSSDTFGC